VLSIKGGVVQKVRGQAIGADSWVDEWPGIFADQKPDNPAPDYEAILFQKFDGDYF